MNDNRPVNLNLATIKFPVTAISSIIHRITGVFLFLAIPLVLWTLATSLSSESGFARAHAMLTSGFTSLVAWAVLSALLYHVIAGVRHILMDMGIGEGAQSGPRGAQLVLALGIVAAILAGVWIW